ncbi:hypothetical protein VNO78_16324 [Psophocarpus tetragonolobus]|uniref:NB-ARC domain-containing protein n=1 Tax=Psophocarpus tetragonolobus TaxID=3891 RepID=A0AAN9XK07_PSOTE
MFDVVVMVSVTKIPDIRKIQGQIADMLGIILNEESDIARANRIQKILNNEKKSTLIILDDVLEKLDLNMLGIPNEIVNDVGLKNVKEGKSLVTNAKKDAKGKSLIAHSMMNSNKLPDASNKEKTEDKDKVNNREKIEDKEKMGETHDRYKGCKILMISESKQILSSQMEQNESSIFSLEALEQKEAEDIFKKNAGLFAENSEFEELATQIVNRCNRLPMAIVTTARALKNQRRSAWEDTYQKLKWQSLSGAPEYSTNLSYDLLDDELKYTFLLCAYMGQHALILDLVKYYIGLRFLEGIYTVRQTRDRVNVLVAKLKESGLLSESYWQDHFSMQDTIRSAALSIARRKYHSFTMTKGKIDEWPDKIESYDAISFHHCDFIEGFPSRIDFPRLRVFHVINNDPNLTLPENFFEGMKRLQVLILVGMRQSLSKSSISSLENLRMLCLEQCCILDMKLSIIGNMKKLRILSFSGSDIENLPVELKQLKKLQIFDISNCSNLKDIPSGVIERLVSLEELYMRNTLIQWREEKDTYRSKVACLSELKHLNQLTTLDIQIPNVSYLPKNLFFDKLLSYKIVIGDLTSYFDTDFKMPEKYETMRFLAIQLQKENIHSLKEIKMMFERVESLFLEELNAVHGVFYRLNLKGFPYLKHLWIVNNHNVHDVFYRLYN